MFGTAMLGGQIRLIYEQNGYADVQIKTYPVKSPETALVTYLIAVIPGPVYHFRSIAIQNLTNLQEAKVRKILGLKAGDIYDQVAINRLYHSLPSEPDLQGLEFGFSPKLDREAASVDLTLDFHKSGGEATVTIK